MYDRNVKSLHILTRLHVLDYEYICDRIAIFHKKILFITLVVNIQILTTKYFRFQHSITYCSQALGRPAHRACKTVHLLTHVTPDFITPALWPANSADPGMVHEHSKRSNGSTLLVWANGKLKAWITDTYDESHVSNTACTV